MRISKALYIIDARAMRAVSYKHFFNVTFQFLNKSEYYSDKSRNIHLYTT